MINCCTVNLSERRSRQNGNFSSSILSGLRTICSKGKQFVEIDECEKIIVMRTHNYFNSPILHHES